jgi:hypothetical protein
MFTACKLSLLSLCAGIHLSEVITAPFTADVAVCAQQSMSINTDYTSYQHVQACALQHAASSAA